MPIRPDMTYATKEPNRTLSPTNDGNAKSKHAIRCLKGTEDDRRPIGLEATTTTGATFDVAAYVDSDRLGRTRFHEEVYYWMHHHRGGRRGPPPLGGGNDGGTLVGRG